MASLVSFGDTSLRLTPPDSERLETAAELTLHADGTASNAAVAAARLGADATWVSKVPDTPLGKRVLAELHAHGLQTDVVWAEADEGRQGLDFAERGARPRDDLAISDRTNAAAGTAAAGELPMGEVRSADAVLVAGSTPALSTAARETTEAVLRAATGTRVLDLDFEPDLWSAAEARAELADVLESVDVLIASENDAQAVFQRSDAARELAHGIASDGDFERVVVTRSEHGAVAWHDNVIHEQDATETDVVDPTGQHDAFVGAFLQQLIADAPTPQALAYGVATAALTRTTAGPLTTVSAAEVESLAEEITDSGDGLRR